MTSLVLTLALLEVACRVWHGPAQLLDWSNTVTQQQARFDKDMAQQWVHDPLLGYAPRPDYHSPQVNHDNRGLRVTPVTAGEVLTGPPLLAGGDSNVYGDELTDADSWPAMLQSLVHRPVRNAGVVAYGFDQAVLRVEQQTALLAPAAIVVGFIADDLRRSEFRHLWGKGKPYFTAADGKTLVLHNVPVPERDPSVGRSFWQVTLGWSALVEIVMRRLGMADEWAGASVRVMPLGEGEHVACLLMGRLAKLGVPTLIVGQYPPGIWRGGDAQRSEQEVQQTRRVLGCAANAGLFTLDTFDLLDTGVRTQGADALFLKLHASPEGNRRIAAAIAGELVRRGVLPR